jgi:hypothetical protein
VSRLSQTLSLTIAAEIRDFAFSARFLYRRSSSRGVASVEGEACRREHEHGISVSSARERVYKAKPKGESL